MTACRRKLSAKAAAAPFRTYTRVEALRLAATALAAAKRRALAKDWPVTANGYEQSISYLRALARDAKKAGRK